MKRQHLEVWWLIKTCFIVGISTLSRCPLCSGRCFLGVEQGWMRSTEFDCTCANRHTSETCEKQTGDEGQYEYLPHKTLSLGIMVEGTSGHKHASYKCGGHRHCRHVRATLRNNERNVCGFVLPAELASCLHLKVPYKKNTPSPWVSGRHSKLVIRGYRNGRKAFELTVDLPARANSSGATWHFRHDTINFLQSWKRTSSDNWDPSGAKSRPSAVVEYVRKRCGVKSWKALKNGTQATLCESYTKVLCQSCPIRPRDRCA